MLLHVDPEFHKLIPPLAPSELDGLERSIKREGCRDAIVIWKGHDVLLDGHNRKDICERNGIKCRSTEIELPDRNAALAWIIRNQFGRRNLNDYQRCTLALKLESILSGMSFERIKAGIKVDDASKKGRTRDKIAAIAGVSSRTIDSVKFVETNGSRPLREAAASGKLSIHAASAIATLPKSEQRKLFAKGIDAVKKESKIINQGSPIIQDAITGFLEGYADEIERESRTGKSGRLPRKTEAMPVEHDDLFPCDTEELVYMLKEASKIPRLTPDAAIDLQEKILARRHAHSIKAADGQRAVHSFRNAQNERIYGHEDSLTKEQLEQVLEYHFGRSLYHQQVAQRIEAKIYERFEADKQRGKLN